MILSLAFRYQKQIALFLLSISFFQVTVAERIAYYGRRSSAVYAGFKSDYRGISRNNSNINIPANNRQPLPVWDKTATKANVMAIGSRSEAARAFIGGPTQPESQTFQSVNGNNMVDLFTGDFSYNIPLLDVGGYPVNIAYHSGITMDEEASWVGLGWNINPGSITRNMRGVPDDFNGGSDTIRKVASIKPNVNWGLTVGADLEILGLPKMPFIDSAKIGISLGVFHTTYNGWGLKDR